MPLDNTTLAAIVVVAALTILMVIGFTISRLYRRASKETSFVRTGMGGQKVVMNGGALVLPVFQETIPVNMNTLRLEVVRNNEAALITKDRMRVDVRAEFYVRVKPTVEAIANAAQTLGRRTMDPGALKELIEGKFVDALRAVAAEMGMEELHEKRVDFVQRVQQTVSEDILKNGLELESVSLTALDQTTQDYFNPQNAFDAQGLTKLTETIEAKRKQRNDIEQETRVQIEMRNLEAERKSLEISRETEYAKLEQEREVSIRRAEQAAEIAREQAERDREAREAEILAKRQIDQAGIVAQRAVEEERIGMERQVKDLEIQKGKVLETAEVEKLKTIELTEQDRAIAIAEKSRAKSEAEAEAARARALAVKAEEEVVTVREREIAERKKQIELVRASEEAEREAIGVIVAAEAEKKASMDRSEAIRIAAEAEAGKIRINAEGEAQAVKLHADADARRYEVEAEGKRAVHEAMNVLSPEIIQMELKKIVIEHLPQILRESVKPMESIEGIKIIHVEGLGGGGRAAAAAGANGADGSLADQLVNSALRYRGQAPLVDALMSEIGMTGGDINGLTRPITGTDGKGSAENGAAHTAPEPTDH
jgi:uncharacterized membrane protein YqiK